MARKYTETRKNCNCGHSLSSKGIFIVDEARILLHGEKIIVMQEMIVWHLYSLEQEADAAYSLKVLP